MRNDLPRPSFSTRTLILMGLLGFFLSSCGISKTGKPDSKDDYLRVMAYNIHHAQPMNEDYIDLDGIAQIIREADADFVALQEVDVNTKRSGAGNQAQILAKKLGMQYFFAKAIDYGGGDYGVAVLSKYPILEEKAISLPHVTHSSEQRVLGLARIQLPSGKQLLFGSIHLDHKGNPQDRLSQLEEVTKVTAVDETPVILAGDFNALPESETMKMVYDHFKPTCTDCGPTFPANDPVKTIDFIVYKDPTDSFRLFENRVIEEPEASDHRPILVRFKER